MTGPDQAPGEVTQRNAVVGNNRSLGGRPEGRRGRGTCCMQPTGRTCYASFLLLVSFGSSVQRKWLPSLKTLSREVRGRLEATRSSFKQTCYCIIRKVCIGYPSPKFRLSFRSNITDRTNQKITVRISIGMVPIGIIPIGPETSD